MRHEFEPKWIPVFRVGDYGVKGRWTEADVDGIVRDYNPALHEAPVVIGHPQADKPAYGWVKGLRRAGSLLEAQILPTAHEFIEWIRQGLFKKISVAIYAAMPETGRPYLRHVGFLGAEPPAVKGLPAAAFHDAWGRYQEMDIAQEVLTEEAVDRIWRGCELFKDRLWMILFGPLEEDRERRKADALAQIDQLRDLVEAQEFAESRVSRVERAEHTPKPGGGKMTLRERLKALLTDENIPLEEAKPAAPAAPAAQMFTEAEVKAREEAAVTKAREEADAQHRAERHRAEVTAFVEGLKATGKFLPAWDKMGMVQLIEGLPAEATITFTEGGKEEKRSPYQVMRAFLEGLPKLVTLEEIAKGGKAPTPEQEKEAVIRNHQKAQREATGKTVTYGEALKAVAKERPELFEEE